MGYDRDVLLAPYLSAGRPPRLVFSLWPRYRLACCFVIRHDKPSALPYQPVDPCQQRLQNFVPRHLMTRLRRYTIPPTPTFNVPFDICLQLRVPCLTCRLFRSSLIRYWPHLRSRIL